MSLLAESRIISASFLVDYKLGFGDDHPSVRRHRPRQPHITTDNGATADDGAAAKDGGACVNDDVVFNRWVALLTADHPAFFVHREAHRSMRDSLIQLDPVPNICRLTSNNARAVIYEKTAADGRAGVDVDSGGGMSTFGHDPRQQGDSLDIQLMGKPVDRDRKDCRISKDHLVDALCRRISIVGGLDVPR